MEKPLRLVEQPEFFGWIPTWMFLPLVVGLGVVLITLITHVLPSAEESQPALTESDKSRIYTACVNRHWEGDERWTWGAKSIWEYCSCFAGLSARHLTKRHVRLGEEQSIYDAALARCARLPLRLPDQHHVVLDPIKGRVGSAGRGPDAVQR